MAGAEGRGRAAQAPHTRSASPMGLRKLHRGRGGSRHFQKPLGFVLGASLFVGVIIPFPAAVGISCAWAKARVTTGTALVKRYALPYASPTNGKICGDPRKCIKCPSKRKRLNEEKTTSCEVSEHLIRGRKNLELRPRTE